eukprot:601743-Prymnesium_polylepis.1
MVPGRRSSPGLWSRPSCYESACSSANAPCADPCDGHPTRARSRSPGRGRGIVWPTNGACPTQARAGRSSVCRIAPQVPVDYFPRESRFGHAESACGTNGCNTWSARG